MYQQTITIAPNYAQTFIQSSSYPQPTAHITKNRGRLKTYGSNVYLKDGSNFEIELFNPKSISVLAKIKINGALVSESGIVVKPGQRVYLERFLDVSKKFLFETYEVEDTAVSNLAIANNGKIEVSFYDETTIAGTSGFSSPSWWGGVTSVPCTFTTNCSPGFAGTTLTLAGASGVGGNSTSTSTAYLNQSSGTISFTSNVSGCVGEAGRPGPAGIQLNETGRIEAGEKSDQVFDITYGSWHSLACKSITWQILPESKKPVEMGDIRSYCTGCGTRHKKSSWKFCPNCGTPVNS